MTRRQTKAIRAAAIAAAVLPVILPAVAHAAITFSIGGSWPENSATVAANGMGAIVADMNAYGNFGSRNVHVQYVAGVPTAQSGYQSQIEVGGSHSDVMLRRVLQHEVNHNFGTGTTSNWTNAFTGDVWTGAKTNALLAQFDGDGSVVRKSGVHFFPYGLNFNTEVTDIDDAIGAQTVYMRNTALLYAMRQDMGLGTAADPWSATTVSLTKSDALGTSAFNNWDVWSDNYFAHASAAYSTGNFQMRTALDTYDAGAATPGFTFAGESLTINNTNGIDGGLLFKGFGAAGKLTFKNLILDGGYVRHASGAGDLFRIAGKMTIAAGGGTFHADQGNIQIEAPIAGVGTLNVATDNNAFVTRILSAQNTFVGTLDVGGRLALAEDANQKFAVGANGVNNAIKGSAASVNLDGVFDLDLSNADSTAGNSWSLVTSSNTTYGDTFTVNGFSYDAGLWKSGNGFVFSPSTGKLSFAAAPTISTWVGNGSSDWAEDPNWVNAPATGNALMFGAAGAAGTTLTDNRMTPVSHTVAGITFAAGAPSYTINAGTAGVNGFSLGAGVVNRSGNVQTINDGIAVPFQRTTFTTNGDGGDLVVNSNVSGAGGIAKAGAGVLTLSGANTYAGGTRVDAGTLLLTGSLNASGGLTLAGGMFTYARPGAVAQSVNGLTVLSGGSVVNNTSGGALALGAITRRAGGTVGFSPTGAAITTTTGNVNGILGPWAFFGTGANTRFATNSGGTITGYTGATAVANFGYTSSETANYDVSGVGGAIGLPRGANTVRYTGAAATVTTNSSQNFTFNALMNAGAGELTFGSDATPSYNVAAGSSGELILVAANAGITITDSIFDGVNGTALTVAGPNTVSLSGLNIYTGKTRIGGNASLVISGGTSLPDAGFVSVATGSTLNVNASETIGALQGGGNVGIAMSQTLTVGGAGAGTMFAGNVFGAGTLSKTGIGVLTLSGVNTYAGNTTISGGTLNLTNATNTTTGVFAIASGGTLNLASLSNYGVNSAMGARLAASDTNSPTDSPTTGIGLRFQGGTLQYTGSTPQSTNRQIRISTAGGTIDASGLSSSATLSFTYSGTNTNLFETPGTRTLTLKGSNAGDNTFAIKLENQATNATSLVKSGNGKWVLTNTNTYTGTTTVDGGTLLVNGNSSAASGNWTVNGGGTLGGTGTIGGTTTVGTGAKLAPGGSTGVLTFSKSGAALTLSADSSSTFEIEGTTRGIQYDGVTLASPTGALTYGGALSIAFTAAVADGSTFDLFQFTATPAGSFASVTVGGVFSASLANLAGVWTGSDANHSYRFTQSNGDLVVTPVPEPASLGIVSVVTLIALSRRRRERAIV